MNQAEKQNVRDFAEAVISASVKLGAIFYLLNAENPQANMPGGQYEDHNANTHPEGIGGTKNPDLSGDPAEQSFCGR